MLQFSTISLRLCPAPYTRWRWILTNPSLSESGTSPEVSVLCRNQSCESRFALPPPSHCAIVERSEVEEGSIYEAYELMIWTFAFTNAGYDAQNPMLDTATPSAGIMTRCDA